MARIWLQDLLQVTSVYGIFIKKKFRKISWKEDRNTKCDAANIDISTVFPYEGKLYGFRSLSDGGSELVVSDLDGGDWKSKGMFITAEEIFQGGVVVGNQMFFLKDVVVRPEDHITEMRTDTVMCVLNFDTMELKELRREKGVFSIQFLGGTKDYQIYSVQEDNGIKCYQFDYDEEESKEISLKNRTQSVVKADETGFYYNSGIDYPKEVYKHDLETSENEICISEEEAKAAFGKEYLQLIIWDVREDGILFHLVDEKEGDVFWKESKSGEIKRLYLEENLPKKNSRLNSFMFGTEDGIGFSYLQSLDSDNIEWYGYISWEDLLAGKNNIKTLVETKFTGGGKDQMFYLKDVALREEEAAEPELETVMCMLDLDTMKSREICRERGTFSIQFLGGTKDYQIYSVKGEDGVTCYQFDYKKEVSKEISLYDIPGRIIGADETGFYYNSGIDYPSAVYRYHFETGENEVFVSKEEAKAAYGKDVFSLSLWDVREEGILFKIWYGEDQRLFLKEADSGKLRQLSLSEELLKEDFVLNGMLFKNEEGLGFEYTQYLDMDQINWYGYISWEDLLSDENNVKVLIEPRMTSRGYPLDEDGNVIGAQE